METEEQVATVGARPLTEHLRDFPAGHRLEPFLSEKDREYWDRYLIPFHKFDGGTKSYNHLPKVQLAKYRDLTESTFPQPILF